MKGMTGDELAEFLSEDVLIEVRKHPIKGINEPWGLPVNASIFGIPVVVRP